MIGQFFSGHYYSIMGPKTGKFFSAEILSDFHQITSTNLMKNRATNFSLLYATNFLMQCRSMLEAELSHAELRFDNREYNICFKTDVFIWQCSVVEFGTFIKAIQYSPQVIYLGLNSSSIPSENEDLTHRHINSGDSYLYTNCENPSWKFFSLLLQDSECDTEILTIFHLLFRQSNKRNDA